VSLSEHRLGDKHFYIFGDEHHKTNIPCPDAINIADFLANLDSEVSPNKKVNIFLEVPYITDTLKRNEFLPEHYLYDIYQKFKPCLSYIKDNCPYPNLTVHYADVRNLSDQVHDLNLYSYQLYSQVRGNMRKIYDGKKLVKIYKGSKEEQYLDTMLDKLSDAMANIYDRDLLPLDTDKIMQESKIFKQLQHIEDVDIRDEIEEFFRDRFEQYTVTYQELDFDAKIMLNGPNPTSVFLHMADLIDKLSWYIMTVMDAYLMARAFRSDVSSPNVIIYAGDNHAVTYRELLETLGFETVAETRNWDQCLDISDFQPFFSSP
jgi:hypothetical protein